MAYDQYGNWIPDWTNDAARIRGNNSGTAWQESWNNRNQSNVGNDVQRVVEGFNPVGMLYGLGNGGKKDPVQQSLDQSIGAENNIPWNSGDEDVYSQMDADQWKELKGLNQIGKKDWIARRRQELKTGKGRPRGKFVDPITGEEDPSISQGNTQGPNGGGSDNEAAYQKWRQDTMQRLDKFSKEMNMPVEELIARGDLGVKQAGATGRSQASSAAYGAGLGGGGISNLNTQRAVTDAQSKYQLQRAGLGLQATSQLMGELGNVGRESEDMRRYDQGMNLQLQGATEQARQRQYAEEAGQRGSLFGLAGGVVGGIYGGPAGAAMGSQLGSGLGRSTMSPYQPRKIQYPSVPSRGLGNYGGSQ